MITLQQLFEKYDVTEIDMLKVDVEDPIAIETDEMSPEQEEAAADFLETLEA